MVGLLKSNRTVTDIQYDARTHARRRHHGQRGRPDLLLKRLRRTAAIDDDENENDEAPPTASDESNRLPPGNALSALLLGSPAIRLHPMLQYQICGAKTLAALVAPPHSKSQAAAAGAGPSPARSGRRRPVVGLGFGNSGSESPGPAASRRVGRVPPRCAMHLSGGWAEQVRHGRGGTGPPLRPPTYFR